MIGTAIGAATALASSIYGAVTSANANRKANRLIQDQRDENQRWYNMKQAEDYTQRSDSQAVLNKQRDLLNEQFKRARATNAVAGGSDEQLALQQQAAADSLSDTMTNIAAGASAYKDNVEQQFRQQDAALNQQQAGIQQNKANTIAQAAGQGVTAGLNLIGTEIDRKKS